MPDTCTDTGLVLAHSISISCDFTRAVPNHRSLANTRDLGYFSRAELGVLISLFINLDRRVHLPVTSYLRTHSLA
jgi:hypothetical protein